MPLHLCWRGRQPESRKHRIPRVFPDKDLIPAVVGCLSPRGWWHLRGGHAEVCLAHSPFMVDQSLGDAVIVSSTKLYVVKRGTGDAVLGPCNPAREQSGEFCVQKRTEATGAHGCTTLHGAATVEYLVEIQASVGFLLDLFLVLAGDAFAQLNLTRWCWFLRSFQWFWHFTLNLRGIQVHGARDWLSGGHRRWCRSSRFFLRYWLVKRFCLLSLRFISDVEYFIVDVDVGVLLAGLGGVLCDRCFQTFGAAEFLAFAGTFFRIHDGQTP